MGTAEATATATGKKPLPPALYLLRAPSLPGPEPDTPPLLRTHVTVPFLWEDAPGRPKATAYPSQDRAADAGAGAPAADATDGPVPLKLPPRLQRVTTTDGQRSPSPTIRAVPYGCAAGATRALRRSGTVATFRRMPSAGVGLFSRSQSKATAAGTNARKGGHELDASCFSPAPSSASSASSSSMSTFFGDDHGHGAHGRPADGRDDSEDEDAGAKGSVRIRRFRRNKSLPSMATSHLWLWASIRRSVKQITPWS